MVKIDLPFEDDPVKLLLNKFLNLKSFSKPFDVEMKLTFTVEDVYYINLTFSNQRTYDGISAPDNFTPAYLSLQGESVGVLVDINDRYGFNYIKGYKSNLEKQKHLFELTTTVLKEKLPEIIEKGEFHL
ncbi:MAG: hypothetical protein M1365_13355 [Actinobacteria bacterium]|nr:hypothetical protein [Actinomycetota bacterium]